ncbi:hypothetical protein GCM10010387_16400 [Streptomyces inusitatus]|uniref:Uncharacterized protein n=1 Tax=Streptomyces inusitatus TaxID=68221 RepID=A0A918UP48_9ACTN|nr:hypothetical protein [Streptomyces inusitatus]GGZ23873.1 hypothetical protein GCM10010387_16400 [Streptomyces inusitatus]
MTEALAVALAVLTVVAVAFFLSSPRPARAALFRVGPLWSLCPAEKRWTPHLVDVGVRRCLSCKTTSTVTEESRG